MCCARVAAMNANSGEVVGAGTGDLLVFRTVICRSVFCSSVTEGLAWMSVANWRARASALARAVSLAITVDGPRVLPLVAAASAASKVVVSAASAVASVLVKPYAVGPAEISAEKLSSHN